MNTFYSILKDDNISLALFVSIIVIVSVIIGYHMGLKDAPIKEVILFDYDEEKDKETKKRNA